VADDPHRLQGDDPFDLLQLHELHAVAGLGVGENPLRAEEEVPLAVGGKGGGGDGGEGDAESERLGGGHGV
jgi:hypothetical protein